MDRREQFFQILQDEMAVTLATAAGDSVTMRAISPVCYQGDILVFTGSGSAKYRQLKENPHCCVAAGPFYAECTATFHGETMLPENKPYRDAYSAKFSDAFAEGNEFGGWDKEFLLLHPTRLTGWAFPNDTPTPDGVPTIPFEILL